MSNTKPVTRRTSHQSPETRRQEIINAAIACFGDIGFNHTTVEQISVEAGLSKGSVYRFFTSKDEILLAIWDKFEKDIDELVLEALDTVDTYLGKIRIILEYSITYISQYSRNNKLWTEFLTHPETKKKCIVALNKQRKDLEVILLAGIKAGEFYEQPIRPAIDMLTSFHSGLFQLYMIDDQFDISSRFCDIWSIIARTLAIEYSKVIPDRSCSLKSK